MATKVYDPDEIQKTYERARVRAQAERHAYERNWFRNVLYYLGIQWITYLPNSRLWIPKNLKKWVPRPVTNKFASYVNTIIQVMSSRSPDISVVPATDDPDDVASAEVGNRVIDVILKEARYKRARRAIATWQVLTGTVFVHPCYDNDPVHGTTFIQHLQCSECGKTFAPDEAGPGVKIPNPLAPTPGEVPPDQLEDMRNLIAGPGEMSENSCPFCDSHKVQFAADEDGKQIGEDLPNGRCNIEVFSPFEIHLDLEARSMAEVQEILVRRRYPLDIIRRKFDHPELESDSGTANSAGTIGLNLLRAIAYAAGNTQYGTGMASGRNVNDQQTITTDFLWKRPCTEFPKGLVAVYANDKNINETEVTKGIPYINMATGKPIWPWHIIVFDEVPGRIMGKTPMDDVAPKQEQRNKLESMMELITRRAANPVWLIAKGIGITEITGEPGEIVTGNWGMDPRLKPVREPGENIPTSLMAWLEKIDRDSEEMAGVFDVLKGSAPPGITAGTALRLLLERAVTRFTPCIERTEEAAAEFFEDILIIFQQYGTEERTARIKGPSDTWEIERFSSADLSGSINVEVEAGSSIPKSAVGQQALISDLTASHYIDPMNPETQYNVLQEFGATKFLGATDKNIKQAKRENWKFQQQKTAPMVDPIIDNHMVHIQAHKQLALTSWFMDKLTEVERGIWRTHILDHLRLAAGFEAAPPPGAGIPMPGSPTNGKGAPLPGAPPPGPGQPMPGPQGIPPMPGGPM